MLPEYMIDFPIKIEYGAEEEKYYRDNTTNAQGDRTKKHLLAREGGSASYEARSVQLINLYILSSRPDNIGLPPNQPISLEFRVL